MTGHEWNSKGIVRSRGEASGEGKVLNGMVRTGNGAV